MLTYWTFMSSHSAKSLIMSLYGCQLKVWNERGLVWIWKIIDCQVSHMTFHMHICVCVLVYMGGRNLSVALRRLQNQFWVLVIGQILKCLYILQYPLLIFLIFRKIMKWLLKILTLLMSRIFHLMCMNYNRLHIPFT